MTFECTPTGQPSRSPPAKTSKKPTHKNMDQHVPWYGRLLIVGALIGATIEFLRLLLTAIVTN